MTTSRANKAHEEPHEEKHEVAPPAPEPQRVVPVGEEQLKRSLEMQKVGVQKWVEEHDERKAGEQPKAVPGVGFRER